ncbi:hypothetical protein MTR67_042984 [Solanum verrucosum]|uniref:Integrase core domain containing protein n=1 Tax=Solanum verrucosum TaxID=315347 RepID=A0AAF0UPF1_SOLVR|nr:hypothetical protein MTR67_042984 [Solanum verrucosum]
MTLARLRADVDAFAATIEGVPEPTLEVEADDIVLSALFGDEMPLLDPPHVDGKITTDDDPTTVEGAIEGVTCDDPAGSEKLDPPTS